MAEVYLDIIARMDKFQTDLNSVKKGMTDLQHKSEEVNNTVRKEFESTGQVANQLQGVIAGLLSVGAITAFIKKMIDLRIEWEKQTAVIKVLTGSQKEAEATMKMIKKVADASLSPLREVSDAYIRLVNQGIKPSYSEMKKMVDVAVSAGRSFGQLAEAIFDATNGQMRGLKDFGIQSKIVGDKLQLSFKGMTESVDMTGESIANFVIKAGELKGVAGASEELGKTIAGAFDDIGDSVESLILKLGELSSEEIVGTINTLNNIVTVLSFLAGNSEKAKVGILGLILELNPFIKLNKELVGAYQSLADAIRNNEKALEDNAAATEASKKLGIELVKVIDDQGRVSYVFKKVTKEVSEDIKKVTDETRDYGGVLELLNTELKRLNELQLKAKTPEEILNYSMAIATLTKTIKDFTDITPSINLEKIESIAPEFESLFKILYPDSNELIKRGEEDVQILGETLDEKYEIYWEFAERVQGIYDTLAQMSLQNMNAELAAAEGNEEKQEEIRRKYAKREQAFAVGQALISGSLAIMKIAERWAGTPMQIAFSVLQAIQTALQIATIKSQKFATGILDLQGRGTGTSDEIPAMLSRHETVMTADETMKFRPYLKAMKEGKFPKLQLDLMKDYVTNNNLTYDNSKEIKELREIRRELSKERTIEYVEGKYKIIKRGGITTKISLN